MKPTDTHQQERTLFLSLPTADASLIHNIVNGVQFIGNLQCFDIRYERDEGPWPFPWYATNNHNINCQINNCFVRLARSDDQYSAIKSHSKSTYFVHTIRHSTWSSIKLWKLNAADTGIAPVTESQVVNGCNACIPWQSGKRLSISHLF